MLQKIAWRTLKVVVQVYKVLLMTAIGGLVLANLAGVIKMLLSLPDLRADGIGAWMQSGWVVGVLLAFVGAVTGKLKFYGVGSDASESENNDNGCELSSKNMAVEDKDGYLSNDGFEQSGMIGASLFFGFCGVAAGAIFGCSLLIIYASAAYSPWAADLAIGDVGTRPESVPTNGIHRPLLTIGGTVPMCLVGVSAAVLGAIGFLGGGIGGALGLVYSRHT